MVILKVFFTTYNYIIVIVIFFCSEFFVAETTVPFFRLGGIVGQKVVFSIDAI